MCRTCENIADTNNQNYVANLKLDDLYPKIQDEITYLSAYADSLLLNVTNNLTESFHSIVCAEVGKRVFHGACVLTILKFE